MRRLGHIAFVLALTLAVPGPVPAAAAGGGTQLWVARYNGPANYVDRAAALAVSPDGTRVYVTGESYGSRTYDYATVSYDSATGAELWVRRYNGPGNGHDGPTALALSPDGTTVYVTGTSTGSGTFNDYATIAYDSMTGAQIWLRRYDGPGHGGDEATALAVSPDGTTLYVTGESTGSGTYYDYTTVAYDSATGARVWVSRYDGPGSDWDFAYALAVSPDGSKVYVTGESSGSDLYTDYATVAYDAATGSKVWVSRYNGPGDNFDSATALAVSPDGSRVYVTGESLDTRNTYDYATAAYNASTGADVWVRRYDGPDPGTGWDRATAIQVSPDGTAVFVTGSSNGSDGYVDYTTVAYHAATGARIWARRIPGKRLQSLQRPRRESRRHPGLCDRGYGGIEPLPRLRDRRL